MSARRKARKRALDFLYESDIRKTSVLDLYSMRPVTELSESAFVEELIVGVNDNRNKIDELIVTYAQGWDLDRMPSVDRNILRIALYELLWSKTVDEKVAISEAIEMAKEMSTEESASYVNGLLGRILSLKPALNL